MEKAHSPSIEIFLKGQVKLALHSKWSFGALTKFLRHDRSWGLWPIIGPFFIGSYMSMGVRQDVGTSLKSITMPWLVIDFVTGHVGLGTKLWSIIRRGPTLGSSFSGCDWSWTLWQGVTDSITRRGLEHFVFSILWAQGMPKGLGIFLWSSHMCDDRFWTILYTPYKATCMPLPFRVLEPILSLGLQGLCLGASSTDLPMNWQKMPMHQQKPYDWLLPKNAITGV